MKTNMAPKGGSITHTQLRRSHGSTHSAINVRVYIFSSLIVYAYRMHLHTFSIYCGFNLLDPDVMPKCDFKDFDLIPLEKVLNRFKNYPF